MLGKEQKRGLLTSQPFSSLWPTFPLRLGTRLELRCLQVTSSLATNSNAQKYLLCIFAYEQQLMGDNCVSIKQVTVEEVMSGKVKMLLSSSKRLLGQTLSPKKQRATITSSSCYTICSKKGTSKWKKTVWCWWRSSQKGKPDGQPVFQQECSLLS